MNHIIATNSVPAAKMHSSLKRKTNDEMPSEGKQEDAQLAADMQLAFDLEAEELQHEQQLDDNPQRRDDIDKDARMAVDLQLAFDRQSGEEQRRLFRLSRNSGSLPVVRGTSIPFSNRKSDPSGAQAAVNGDGMAQTQYQSLIYVPAEINACAVEMMVDTGAQCSVISNQLMRKLGLQSKLNSRMQGFAKGVGRARVLGVIENCPVEMGHVAFLLFFIVLDIAEDMIVLGIDQMRRFRCLIDLENEKLIFGGKDGVEVSFLPSEPVWPTTNNPMPESCHIS